jgi:quaternary ammonium compound-resistance protein SugE
MSWLYLVIAGLFEVVWAVGLKYCEGTKFNLALITVILAMTLSMVFLALAIRAIPISLAYAVWTGIGIIGVFLYGSLILKEPVSFINLIFVGFILIGIVGLKLSAKGS